MPNSSRLLATPANSRHDVAEVGDDEREHQEERDAEAELLANQVAQALAGDRAHPRRHLLHDHQRDRDRDHRPEQRVAELRAGQRIGADAAGVVVDVGGDEARADDGQNSSEAGAPALERASSAAVSSVPQHRDHVVGRDDAGEPPVLVDDRERDQVVLVEQRRHFVLGRVGRAGDVRLAQVGELRGRRRDGDLDERHRADQLVPGAGQVDRRDRFAAALEPLQRLDRVVDDRGFRRPR